MSNVNLKQLEVFVAVAEHCSFTEAANRLYLAQSTVSSHVRALEEELKLVLFRRESKKNVALTADGKRIYQCARDIIAKCAELEGDVAAALERELVIGASTVPIQYILPEHVYKFLQAHPLCCCTMKSGDSEQIHRMLLDGDIQVGFVGTSDRRQSLVYEKIAGDRLVMITPNTPRFAHLQAKGTYGRELLNEPLVFREQGSGTQKLVDNYLSSIDMDSKKIKTAVYASSPEAQRSLVMLGMGVSILSNLSVEEQVASGRLLQFELDRIPVSRNFYMVHRKRGGMSGLAAKFAAFVRNSAAQSRD